MEFVRPYSKALFWRMLDDFTEVHGHYTDYEYPMRDISSLIYSPMYMEIHMKKYSIDDVINT